MSSASEREIILEYALSNQENLKTTLDIGLAFSDLKEKIIVGFLDKLEKSVLGNLKRRSDGSKWKTVIDDYHDNLRESPLEIYRRFGFGKESWGKQYGVALEPHKNDGREVIIGVWRRYDGKTGEDARRFQPKDHLRKELYKIRPGGTNGNLYWEWHHPLDNPYRNWNTKEALIKLYNGEAVNEIGQELLNIIEVAAPIIDAHVQGSSS